MLKSSPYPSVAIIAIYYFNQSNLFHVQSNDNEDFSITETTPLGNNGSTAI